MDMRREPDLDFEAAFDELFPKAQRLARRITGSAASAEDVAAEAMARAYARWRKVRKMGHRDAWVLRVATNLAIDRVRRTRPEAEHVETADATDDVIAVRMTLAAALAQLPRRQREAVVLRHLIGYSEADTAEALGVSAGTVKTHVHRGLAALRERLGTIFEEVDVVADES